MYQYFSSNCTFHETERWIGLHREDTSRGCGSGVSADDCNDVRKSFKFFNGNVTTYSNWEPNEPGRGEGCVRLTGDGRWAGYPCRRRLKSVCNLGVHDVNLILQQFVQHKRC